MDNKELLKQRPDVKDYDLQTFKYIADLTKYIEKLEKQLTLTSVVGQSEQLSDFLNYCREIKTNINYPDHLVLGDYWGWWKSR